MTVFPPPSPKSTDTRYPTTSVQPGVPPYASADGSPAPLLVWEGYSQLAAVDYSCQLLDG